MTSLLKQVMDPIRGYMKSIAYQAPELADPTKLAANVANLLAFESWIRHEGDCKSRIMADVSSGLYFDCDCGLDAACREILESRDV